MENGSMVRITCSGYGAPLFPDKWIRGELPPNLKNGTIGIILASKVEEGEDPRRFLKLFTSEGIGWINVVYCVEIG